MFGLMITVTGAITCVLMCVVKNVHAMKVKACLDARLMFVVKWLSAAQRHLADPSEVIAIENASHLHPFLYPLCKGGLHPDEDTLHVGSCDRQDERTLFPE